MSHQITTTLGVEDGINRIKDYCRENGYRVQTNDLEAAKMADNILKYSHSREVKESYKISTIFNFSEVHITEGTLLEILFDFKLLDKHEYLKLDVMGGAGFMTHRRVNIRLQWDRRDASL